MKFLRRCAVVLLVTGVCGTAVGGASVQAAPVLPAVARDVPMAAGQMAAPPIGASVAPDDPAPFQSTPPVDYVEGCPDPGPGHYTCYSLHIKGFHPLRAVHDGFGPADLRSAYALPSATPAPGTGPTVYVIDAFSYPHAESDLAAYRADYGLGACTTANGCFTKLDQRGGTNYPTRYVDGWAGETALDLDMVSAVCPNCKITLIQADTNGMDLFYAVDRANQLGAKYVSMSWGGPEDGNDQQNDDTYFDRPGVVYAASSGDGAYGVGVSYPSTAKNAVAVGGTTLVRAGGARGWSESVWDDSARDFGTGSGCSANVEKPVWQQVIPSAVCSRRAGNDVAAVADPDTGVAVYQLGSPYGDWSVSGGTSAAAPIIAAVYALAGTPGAADRPASYPYARARALNDVVNGRNGTCSPALLCTAAAGWDGPTGLGTPNGLAAFGKPAQVITLPNPGDQTSSVGSAVSLSLSATDAPARAVSFTATGLPTGLTVSTGATSAGTTTARITGVTTANGVFAITVTAADSNGGATSIHLTWTVGRPGTYVPVRGNRVLDTRTGIGAPAGQVYPGEAISVQIAGRGGIPGSGVSAVVLNVTATGPAGTGWVSLSATGAPRPNTSNLNFTKGQDVAGLVVTQLSGGGAMDVFSSAQTHVLADVVGYYLAGSAIDAGAFTPLAPVRLLDTRRALGAPTGKVRPGSAVSLQVAGRGGVPAGGVGAVILNVTATASTGSGWVTAYPDLVTRPNASNLNFLLDRTVPNLVVVPVSSNGKVRLSVSGASVDLIADVFGYYLSDPPQVAGAFGPLTSARVLDSRNGTGIAGTPVRLAAGSSLRVKIAGQGKVPATGVSAVVLNLTAVGATAGGWATLYADGTAKPPTSNLNYARNQTVANLVVVPVSAAGYITVSVSGSGTTDLFADVAGYFSAG